MKNECERSDEGGQDEVDSHSHRVDIIRTPYGLELVKVEDRHVKPFSEIRQELEAQIRKTQADQVIQKLIGESKVVVDNQYFSFHPQPQASGSPVVH